MSLGEAGDSLAEAELRFAKLEREHDRIGSDEWCEEWRDARADVLARQVWFEAERQHWLALTAADRADQYRPLL